MSFVLPRRSRNIEFLEDLPEPRSEDTVTRVMRPGLKKLTPLPANAKRPPKARTTTEVSLPSVIVRDSTMRIPLAQLQRVLPSIASQDLVETVVSARPYMAPHGAEALRPDSRHSNSGARTTAVLISVLALIAAAAILTYLPLWSAIFGDALAVFHR